MWANLRNRVYLRLKWKLNFWIHQNLKILWACTAKKVITENQNADNYIFSKIFPHLSKSAKQINESATEESHDHCDYDYFVFFVLVERGKESITLSHHDSKYEITDYIQ